MRNDHPSQFWHKSPFIVERERAADQRINQLAVLQKVHWQKPHICPCPYHKKDRHTDSMRQLQMLQTPIEEVPTRPPAPKTEEVPAITRDTREMHVVVQKPTLHLRQLIRGAVGEYGQKHGYLPCCIEMSAENFKEIRPFFPYDWLDGYPVGDIDHTIIPYAQAGDLNNHTIRCITGPLEFVRA